MKGSPRPPADAPGATRSAFGDPPVMGRLLALFIVVPAVELALLIEVGSRIGTAATLGIIVGTGAVGAFLARRQGLGVLQRLQSEVEEGGMPADPLVDGAFLLVAGALLVTPGILTDVVGFLCLVPGFRNVVKAEVRRRIEQAVAEQRLHVHVAGDDPFGLRREKVIHDVQVKEAPKAPHEGPKLP
jgi:UPF0716 protein FxsA